MPEVRRGQAGSVPAPPRVALYLQDKHPIRDGIRYAQHAEARGFEAVWQAESRLVREATVPMAAYASHTRDIKVGSGVVNTWTRNVGLLAATFVTLDDLAPGRIMLGLGAWWDPLARKVGIDRTSPLRCMRETVEASRRLFTLDEVSYQGKFVHLDGVRIDVVHGNSSPRDIPIYIGATGPKMLELAGEIADGVLLNYMVSPKYNDDALERIEAGAKRVGRRVEDIDRPQLVVCSVDRDRKKALDAARILLTQYLGQQPHIMKASGVAQSLIDKINEIVDWPATHEEIVRASAYVPDDIVQMVSASGTPEDCRTKVSEYIAHGATCPVLYPLGDDVELMIDTFAAAAVRP
jgi:5,10-methylenetetrahydromethanopterin reductase